MIEENKSYECSECRETFEFYHDLEEHIEFNHMNKIENLNSNKEILNINIDNAINNNKFLKQINKIEDEMINSLKNIEKELRSSSEEEIINKINNKTFITEDLLDIGTIYSTAEEVEEINLKNKNLDYFNDSPKNPYFDKLQNVLIIDLSKNNFKQVDDLQKIRSVRSLNISSNKINNILFIDNLINLEVFIASKNEITSISSLVSLKQLRILEIQENKISYTNSTMKSLGNIRSLKELKIYDNPFLKDFIGYKHTFINKFKKLEKLDDEEITEVERDLAKEYVKKYAGEIHSNEENDRPKTAKSVLNIRTITNIHKNKEEDFFEKDENEEKELKTAYNFFPKDKPREETKTLSENKIDNSNELKINELKDKYDQINIKFEEIPRLTIIPKAKSKIKDKNSVTFVNPHNKDNLKSDNEKLKEEIEFLKNKLSSYETVIESQKMEIEMLQSFTEFNKESKKKEENEIQEKEQKKDVEINQLKKELYSLLFDYSCLKKENEKLKDELKSKGSYKTFKEKIRPQTAIGVDQSFSFNPKSDEVENENFEEDEEDIDHELDDLLRKSTQNLNCLKEEIQYLQTQTTANSNSFKKVNIINKNIENQNIKLKSDLNYTKKDEVLVKPRQRSLSKITLTKEILNIVNKK